MDGKGNALLAVLRVRGEEVLLETPSESVEIRHSTRSETLPVTLELAALKGDAMEWAIEKAVELGAARVAPLITAHTVVQMDRKGPEAFRERWQKIADQALKQCGRLSRMEILLPEPLDQAMSRRANSAAQPRVWCDESSRGETPELLRWLALPEQNSLQELRILIGPEGGWSEKERGLLQSSGARVSLGPLVLRAETAAIAALSIATASFRARKG